MERTAANEADTDSEFELSMYTDCCFVLSTKPETRDVEGGFGNCPTLKE
jgi:hypothetical protein